MKRKHLVGLGAGILGLLLVGGLFIMGKVAYAVSTDNEAGLVIQGYIEMVIEQIGGFIKLAELILGVS